MMSTSDLRSYASAIRRGHVASAAAFIQDISIGKPVVRERCIFIGDHVTDRTLICEIAADPFAGQVTFTMLFRRNILNGFVSVSDSVSAGAAVRFALSYRNGFYGVIFCFRSRTWMRMSDRSVEIQPVSSFWFLSSYKSV